MLSIDSTYRSHHRSHHITYHSLSLKQNISFSGYSCFHIPTKILKHKIAVFLFKGVLRDWSIQYSTMNAQDRHFWYQQTLLQYFLKDYNTKTEILKKCTAEYICTKCRVLAGIGLANFQRACGSATEQKIVNFSTPFHPQNRLKNSLQLNYVCTCTVTRKQCHQFAYKSSCNFTP